MQADRTHLRRLAGRFRGDAGISTVELVIATPLMLLMVLLLVGFGLMVQSRSALDGAARDAARAGALQRDYGTATAEATRAARASAASVCSNGNVQVSPSGDWRAGGIFTVTVSCDVRGLAWLGINSNRRVTSTSTAPLDTFRRTS
ncbi:TadE/TadG family type IV pilus assembly protein [Streptomyces sp. NRRL B-24484]|uniref:TadE/TadG family type IV pilus assembly protein n=1 Tax=Streptomyces sp. NRRL B-24484 TaxID=1463833 RepID=UPI00069348ED|nr:TadE/TadG family type IV pilus assembly protein [Streptomyces sp. NRRL B-24484]